ncbi:hypothetical protein AAC387_Pa05g2433 [Persea americana]
MIFQRDSPQSLSFRNLPNPKRQERTRDVSFERRPNTPDKEFEFFASFNGLHSEMCFAEEIFSNGKLFSFKSPTPNNTTTTTQAQVWNSPKKDLFNAKKSRAIKHGCSAEYRMLEEDPSPTKSQTQKSKRISNGMSGRSWLSKWFLLMFGSTGMPAEMEIRDIRSRQRRLSPTTFVQAMAGYEEEERKRMWKLLRAMSCRSVADVGTPLKFQVARVRVG